MYKPELNPTRSPTELPKNTQHYQENQVLRVENLIQEEDKQ